MKKYSILHPAKFRLDGGAMYGIIPKPLWQRNSPPDELNRIDLSLRLLLIQDGDKNILIDTGIGDYHGSDWNDRFDVRGELNPLEKLLKNNIGIAANEITDLIISHLHFDHIGGLVKNYRDEFPCIFENATLHLHKKHYEYALNPTARDTGSFETRFFKPIIEEYDGKEKVNWLDGDEGTIEGLNLKFKTSHGHTPWLIHPYDEKFMYMADLVPTANHVKIPWVMGYDISPGQTTKDKEKIYPFIIENNLTMIFEHDVLCWGAKLKHDERKGYVPADLFASEEVLSLEVLND